MKYFPACIKCGVIVERDKNFKRVVCFNCKMKRIRKVNKKTHGKSR